MKWPDLKHIEGYLPPDLEKTYRQYYLRDDTRTASITMSLLCFLLLAFAFNDYLLFGLSFEFYGLLGLRALALIYFIALIIFINHNHSPKKYDISLGIWLVLSVLMMGFINFTRPADYSGNYILDVILVLLVYLCIPTRLAFRVTGAVIFTIIEIVIIFALRQIASPVLAFTAVISLVAANIGGIFSSSIMHSFRRREYQVRLEKEKLADQWQITFDSITDPVSIHDRDFRIIRANKAFLETFRVNPEELQNKRCHEIIHSTSHPIENCPHLQTVQSKKPVTEEIFEPRLGIHIEVSTSPIHNSAGEVTGAVHLAKDITERKLIQKKLEEMWTHDFLTGLPNRAILEDRFAIATAQARRKNGKLAIMTLDLDHFKLINDSLGHAAGDQVLKSVAGRLQKSIRSNDTVSRIGGDEFQVLMQDAGEREKILIVADRILRSFNKPFKIEGNSINTSTSIGIAIFPEDGDNLETLSKKSDSAMYQSKGKGRNCYTFYHP